MRNYGRSFSRRIETSQFLAKKEKKRKEKKRKEKKEKGL